MLRKGNNSLPKATKNFFVFQTREFVLSPKKILRAALPVPPPPAASTYTHRCFIAFQVSTLPNEADLNEINERLQFFKTPLELKPSDFEENPRLREHFKLMLNAGLGKLAQRKKKSKNFFVSEAEEISQISNEEEILNIFDISDSLCHISTSAKKSDVALSNLGILSQNENSNPILYAFITARTRILLHQNIMKLCEKNFTVYYCDCDGLFFTGKKGQPLPLDIGACFGQFRAQFGKDCSIQSFVSHGRKNYKICLLENGKVSSIFKLSGLSLDSELAKEAASAGYTEKISPQNDSTQDQEVPQIRHTHGSEFKTICEVQKFTMRKNVVCQRRVDYTKLSIPTYPWGYRAKTC